MQGSRRNSSAKGWLCPSERETDPLVMSPIGRHLPDSWSTHAFLFPIVVPAKSCTPFQQRHLCLKMLFSRPVSHRVSDLSKNHTSQGPHHV